MRPKLFLCACAVLLATSDVHAHGPQLQIAATDGQIITHSILTDNYAPLTTPKSVYVMEVLNFRGVWYARPETALNPLDHPTAPNQPVYYSGAGLAYGAGKTFAAGSVLSIKFTSGLQLWDGTSFGTAGSTQLQYYRDGSIGTIGQLIHPTASIVTSDGGPSPNLSFTPIAADYDAEAHATARLRFLGDGTTSTVGSGPQTGTLATEPTDGVYLASLVIASSDPALDTSDPYHFVMHKNVAWSEVAAAVRSLDIPVSAIQVLGVPEPSTLCLAAVIFGVFAWGRSQA